VYICLYILEGGFVHRIYVIRELSRCCRYLCMFAMLWSEIMISIADLHSSSSSSSFPLFRQRVATLGTSKSRRSSHTLRLNEHQRERVYRAN
jgi:hypothetical protein